MAHSEEKIAETLAVLRANDGNISQTSRDTGVAWQTIKNWTTRASVNPERHQAITKSGEAKKQHLGDIFEGFIRQVFAVGITQEKIQKTPIKDLMVSAAVAAEKMQLVRGEPTDINEQRGLTVLQQFNQQINQNGRHE